LAAALALATCSAAFSISGLTSIFAGAFWAVIGLGVAFEIGKLSAVARVGHCNGARLLRLALVTLVAVLMVLNSIGVYGFLSRAHIEHALAGDLTVASKAADVEARLAVQASVVTDLETAPSSRPPRTAGAKRPWFWQTSNARTGQTSWPAAQRRPGSSPASRWRRQRSTASARPSRPI
jgi:hypothetical protein